MEYNGSPNYFRCVYEEKIFMGRFVIFLDDGGVMNDNRKRGSQWQYLVSEFFVPLLGGTSEAWMEANRIVIDRLFEPVAWQTRLQLATDYKSFDRTYQLDWLRGMCELVGIGVPAEEECFALARRATAFIIPRVKAAFPGAAEAIRTLHHLGYTLHTASGEPSNELAGHLQGMEVRDCFECLYGPDLIDTFKNGPAYYERLFADIGIMPADALVVDDSPQAVDWAAQVGARTVLVGDGLYAKTRATLNISCLAELPAAIQQIED
jgi:HAD superfamily hydrolase (TIGR01509 family)